MRVILNQLLLVLLLFGSAQAQLLNQRNWRASEKDSLNKALNLIDEQNYSAAFASVQNIYAHHPQEDFLKYAYVKCAIEFDDRVEEAYKKLNELFEKNANTADIQYYLAKGAYKLSLFDEALSYMNVFLGSTKVSFQLLPVAQQLKNRINHARYYATHTGSARLQALGPLFNDEGNQVSPVINLAASQLFYTDVQNNLRLPSQKINQSLGKMMYSKSIDENWLAPDSYKNWFEKEHARIAAISADAKHLLLIKENCGQNDIFICSVVADKFSKAKRLKGSINSLFNENACCFSPDGRSIYFSSNRPGGFGGYDLYRADLETDSTWSHVKNLGALINSDKDEDSPCMQADGSSFFFSSEGFESCGGFDVFKAIYIAGDSVFSNRENLGFPINSIANDFGFVISANAEEAFICSDRKGGKGLTDLYKVEPNFKNYIPTLCILKTKVQCDGQFGQSQVKVIDKKTGKLVSESFCTSANMPSMFVLSNGNNYELVIKSNRFKPKKIDLDLSAMQGFIELHKEIEFVSGVDSLNPLDIKNEVLLSSANNHDKKSKAGLNNQVEAQVVNHNAVKSENANALFHFQTFKTSGNSIGMASREESDLDVRTKESKKSQNKHDENIKIELGAIENTQESNVEKSITLIQNLENITDSAEIEDRKALMDWFGESASVAVKETFIPKTETQKRILACKERNGGVRKAGLTFKIQIAANKENSNKQFPQLKHLGKIEKMDYHDDFIRYTIGGDFKTYAEAFELGKKVIEAGYSGIYIFGVMDGKRYKVEDLIAEGIFK